MRKIIPALVAIAALAVPATSMANASPAQHGGQGYGNNAGVTETGWVGTAQGNSQQYSSTYSDPVFGGPITCNGVHLKKQNQDSFTCTLNQGGTWGQTPTVGTTVSWNSDFYGVTDPQATHNGSMTITSVGHDALGNVTSYTGLATYTS
jgi:hypothetical protein